MTVTGSLGSLFQNKSFFQAPAVLHGGFYFKLEPPDTAATNTAATTIRSHFRTVRLPAIPFWEWIQPPQIQPPQPPQEPTDTAATSIMCVGGRWALLPTDARGKLLTRGNRTEPGESMRMDDDETCLQHGICSKVVWTPLGWLCQHSHSVVISSISKRNQQIQPPQIQPPQVYAHIFAP
ncbi:hypothetical protein FPV67DRAFT_1451018 [Lyophyllum atratum]|nr:hypothetical protein FPV67DRAFT_1451018 [Lyophyllum atratum]